MKVAFCSAEVVPFAKTGGLADVCGTLPIALEKQDIDVNIFLPRYKSIDVKDSRITKLNSDLYTTKIGQDIDVYFIENKDLFNRDGLYGDKNGDYPDNLERFQFFCHKTLEVLKQLNLKVDIVHCHDWHTALIPAYLKDSFAADEFYKEIKTVLTIHNLAYQGVFPKEDFEKLNLDKKLYSKKGFEFYNQVNFLKGGIRFSDLVTTVSKGYAEEIQTEEFGCGLAEDLKTRSEGIWGIINGLDYSLWDPKSDKLISINYNEGDLETRRQNKQVLQQSQNLDQNDQVPVFGFVGRLDYQKGIELIEEAMSELMEMDLQLVVLGTGDGKYHDLLEELAAKYTTKLAAHLHFDEHMAHQIYAGSDIFLMPSRFEPCGLTQMISLAYGAIPLVHKTGGLADTITHYNQPGGNGFVFEDYDKDSLVSSVREAVEVFHNAQEFEKLVKNAFNFRFSWENSAKEYKKVFEECLRSE